MAQNLLDNTTSSTITDPSEDCRFLENSFHLEPLRLVLYQANISRNQKNLINVWPHQVNKNSQIINCHQTTIICKTWRTILQTNQDLTTWVLFNCALIGHNVTYKTRPLSPHRTHTVIIHAKHFSNLSDCALELRNKGKNVQIHNLWNHIWYSNYTINMMLFLKHS